MSTPSKKQCKNGFEMDLPNPTLTLHIVISLQKEETEAKQFNPHSFSVLAAWQKNISVLIIIRVKVECRKNHTFLEGMFSDVTYTGLRGNLNPTRTDHE